MRRMIPFKRYGQKFRSQFQISTLSIKAAALIICFEQIETETNPSDWIVMWIKILNGQIKFNVYI